MTIRGYNSLLWLIDIMMAKICLMRKQKRWVSRDTDARLKLKVGKNSFSACHSSSWVQRDNHIGPTISIHMSKLTAVKTK